MAMHSDAAQSIARIAARHAATKPGLEALMREMQDFEAAFQKVSTDPGHSPGRRVADSAPIVERFDALEMPIPAISIGSSDGSRSDVASVWAGS